MNSDVIFVIALYIGGYSLGFMMAFLGGDDRRIFGFNIMFGFSLLLLIAPFIVFIYNQATLFQLLLAALPGLSFCGLSLFLLCYIRKINSTQAR